MTITPANIYNPTVADLPIGLVQDRVKVREDRSHNLSSYQAAKSLWEDEWQTFQALSRLPGLDSAAECAWQRRSCASALAMLLIRVS
jgi:hypothetical protein